jgi:16S rRNA G966 N2-methylase RsmD
VQVQRADGLAHLNQLTPQSVDLIFIDPPFDGALFGPALKAAAAAVKADGYVYLEAPQTWADDALAEHGLALYRQLKAGAVHAHLLRRLA